jgi:AcrR family transcriptional regulator
MPSPGTDTDTLRDTDSVDPITEKPRRRRADAERNVAAIVTAARDLLCGGTLPSMGEVAVAASVGRVTLYAHFASREALLDAVVRQVMAETDEALTGLRLDDDPPQVALDRLVRTSWQILDRHRTVRSVTLAELGPEALREQHERVARHVERLIARGQADGVFRADLPGPWLVASFYATVHAAADEVSGGRLDAEVAPDVLGATLRSILQGD